MLANLPTVVGDADMHPPTSTGSMSTRVQHPHRVSGHIPSHLVSAPRSSIKARAAPRTLDPTSRACALSVRVAHVNGAHRSSRRVLA